MSIALKSQIGSYEVVRLAGRGAMGEVYEASDRALGRKVALKILCERHLKSEEFLARFEREGRALAALNHPNVLQIYDCGSVQGRPFLATEFLEGEDVGVKLKCNGPLRPEDAAEVIRQAAIGLSQTVDVGVVHRDVKPANLVVSDKGRVIVTDFGLSKSETDGKAITKAGLFVGTPDYLAPEQALGKSVDVSADIYALGCSLFHMCTGRPPFRNAGSDDAYTTVVRRHLKSERPRLSDEVPGIDEELSMLCRRMMSRRVEVRPSYPELIERLGALVQRCKGRCPPRPAEVDKLPQLVHRSHDKECERSSSKAQQRRSMVIGVAAGSVITLAFGLLLRFLVH